MDGRKRRWTKAARAKASVMAKARWQKTKAKDVSEDLGKTEDVFPEVKNEPEKPKPEIRILMQVEVEILRALAQSILDRLPQ